MLLCMICGEPGALTITFEARGMLRHYPTCWNHVEGVVLRVRGDAGQPREISSMAERSQAARRVGVVEVRETPPQLHA